MKLRLGLKLRIADRLVSSERRKSSVLSRRFEVGSKLYAKELEYILSRQYALDQSTMGLNRRRTRS